MLSWPKPVVSLTLDGLGCTLDIEYDVRICNYADCDMVGHTGIIDASILAVAAVDALLQRVVDALKSAGGRMLIIADHGNIEQRVDKETGQPHTAHTINPVLSVYVGGDKPLDASVSLLGLASTVPPMVGVEMAGRSLIKFV